MKFSLVFMAILAVCAGHAIHFPTSDVKFADKDFLYKQKFIFDVLHNLHMPMVEEDYFKDIHGFVEGKEYYDDYDKVMRFFMMYKYGLLPRDYVFSIFNYRHVTEMKGLFYLFYYSKDWQTFYHNVLWARHFVNDGMFVYALYAAVIHRDDMQGIILPAHYEVLPYMYFNGLTIDEILKYKTNGAFTKLEGDVVIFNKYSDDINTLNEESKLTYFTEDIGWNMYYFFFNLDYPYWLGGKDFELYKDRRGEQFLYMHQQLLARYYLERLSNKMGPILDFTWKSIKTGYDPHMRYYNGLPFTVRKNYYEMYSTDDFYALNHGEDFERRIRDVIDLGYFPTVDGGKIDLWTTDGIDLLGNLIQSNPDSMNEHFFGKLIVYAHKMLSGGKFREIYQYKITPGVLEHFETSLRDPVFYQFYKRIVYFYFRFKEHLEPYTFDELFYHGIKINNVEVSKLVTYFDYFDSDVGTMMEVDKFYDYPEEYLRFGKMYHGKNYDWTKNYGADYDKHYGIGWDKHYGSGYDKFYYGGGYDSDYHGKDYYGGDYDTKFYGGGYDRKFYGGDYDNKFYGGDFYNKFYGDADKTYFNKDFFYGKDYFQYKSYPHTDYSGVNKDYYYGKDFHHENDFYGKDFYGKDFYGKDFYGKDFYGKDFYGKDFYNKDFYGNKDFYNKGFYGKDFYGKDFHHGKDFYGKDFYNKDLYSKDFHHGKDFYGKDFYGKDFYNKDFHHGKDFYGKDFYGKDFYNKDFYGNKDFYNKGFYGKDFYGKDFHHGKDFYGKDFYNKDFYGKNFYGKDFYGKDFYNKDFYGKDYYLNKDYDKSYVMDKDYYYGKDYFNKGFYGKDYDNDFYGKDYYTKHHFYGKDYTPEFYGKDYTPGFYGKDYHTDSKYYGNIWDKDYFRGYFQDRMYNKDYDRKLIDTDYVGHKDFHFDYHYKWNLGFDYKYKVRTLRLNHKPFNFNVDVTSDKPQTVVFRVYMGPKFDYMGKPIDINLNRENFVEIDQFLFDLKLGHNTVLRESRDFYYSVRDRTMYTDLYKMVMLGLEGHHEFPVDMAEAHCGFPDRLLLPRGWVSGMPMQFFFMITPFQGTKQFSNYKFWFSCGIGSGNRFIDNLPFGYPFDRHIDEDYFFVPNMYFKDVQIYHIDDIHYKDDMPIKVPDIMYHKDIGFGGDTYKYKYNRYDVPFDYPHHE